MSGACSDGLFRRLCGGPLRLCFRYELLDLRAPQDDTLTVDLVPRLVAVQSGHMPPAYPKACQPPASIYERDASDRSRLRDDRGACLQTANYRRSLSTCGF